MIKRKCAMCSKQFLTFPCRNKKLCNDCRRNIGKGSFKCQYCGRVMRVYLSRAIVRKFCSHRCWILFSRGKPHSKEWNKKVGQPGERNPMWKGDGAGYKAFHYRVKKALGQPKKCEICGTIKSPRYEWANLTGKYNDIKDYKRMCRSCHAKFDGIGHWLNKKIP